MPVSEHEDTIADTVPATWPGLLKILDTWYPADVFTTSSEDVGARLVVLARELARLRAALAYMADPENWAGDPHQITSHLHGHDTPYELARDALDDEPREFTAEP